MERGGCRGRRGGYGSRGRGGGRGERGDHHHHHHHHPLQWQSGRRSGHWRNQDHAGPRQSGSQISHVGTIHHPDGGRTGCWGSSGWKRSTSFPQVRSQRPSVSPECLASEHMSSSSSSPENVHRLLPMNRPDTGTHAMRKVGIHVNHFPVNFIAEMIIRHYDVDIKQQKSCRNGRSVKIPKFNLSMIRNKLSSEKPKNFPLDMTAYDGEKNIFSAVELRTGEFVVKLFDVSYVVSVKLVNELRLSELKDYLSGTGKVMSVPRDTLQAMDLAMKENPKRYAIPIRSYQGSDLGRGIIASHEPKYRLKLTSQGLVLVLDYSVFPFLKRVPVIDYLKEHIHGFDINQFEIFQNEVRGALKGLKVYKTHLGTKQSHVIAGLTTKSARQISFTIKDWKGNAPARDVLLVDYFRDRYNKEIVYNDIPCLDLGKNNHVPLELCVLAEMQRYPRENLERHATNKLRELSLPKVREKIICDLVQARDGPCGGSIAQNFGIAVDRSMTKVTGRVISPPELKVGVPGGGWTTRTLHNKKCDWNLAKNCVVEGKQIEKWVVLDFTCSESDRNRLKPHLFIQKLIDLCEALGIRMKEPLLYEAAAMCQLNNVDMILELLESIKARSHEKGKGYLHFILCMMAREHPGYKYLKWVSETRIGIMTQCCLSTNKVSDQYLVHLALSINVKNMKLRKEKF